MRGYEFLKELRFRWVWPHFSHVCCFMMQLCCFETIINYSCFNWSAQLAEVCLIFVYNKELALHRCVSPYMCWFPSSATKSHSNSLQGASLTVSVLYEYVKQNISHARLWIPRGVVMMDLASCEEHMLYYDGFALFRNKHHRSTQTCAFRKKDNTTKSFMLKESNTSCLHTNDCFGVLVVAWIA